MTKLDQWWSSLTTAQKERIATKAARKDGNETANIHYPECTAYWLSLDEARQHAIYQHCTDNHGLLLPEWKEGNTLSY